MSFYKCQILLLLVMSCLYDREVLKVYRNHGLKYAVIAPTHFCDLICCLLFDICHLFCISISFQLVVLHLTEGSKMSLYPLETVHVLLLGIKCSHFHMGTINIQTCYRICSRFELMCNVQFAHNFGPNDKNSSSLSKTMYKSNYSSNNQTGDLCDITQNCKNYTLSVN